MHDSTTRLQSSSHEPLFWHYIFAQSAVRKRSRSFPCKATSLHSAHCFVICACKTTRTCIQPTFTDGIIPNPGNQISIDSCNAVFLPRQEKCLIAKSLHVVMKRGFRARCWHCQFRTRFEAAQLHWPRKYNAKHETAAEICKQIKYH